MDNEIIRIKKKRYKFSVIREKFEISKIMTDLPEDEEYKIVSGGGFSSIGFISLVAEKVIINELTVSTLRVGKKHLQILNSLHSQGRIDRMNFVVGGLMKNDSQYVKSFGYYDDLIGVCKKTTGR